MNVQWLWWNRLNPGKERRHWEHISSRRRPEQTVFVRDLSESKDAFLWNLSSAHEEVVMSLMKKAPVCSTFSRWRSTLLELVGVTVHLAHSQYCP